MLVTDLFNWNSHQHHEIIHITFSSTLLPPICLKESSSIRKRSSTGWKYLKSKFWTVQFLSIHRPFFAPWSMDRPLFDCAFLWPKRGSPGLVSPSTVIIYRYQWKSMAYQPALKSIKSERRRDRIARNLERANKEVNIYLI